MHPLATRMMLATLATAVTVTLWATDQRIMVEAKLNDQPLRLAVDTGADELVLFSKAVEKRGIKVTPPPADTQIKPGQVALSRTEPVKLEIAGRIFPDVNAAVFANPPALSWDVDGVLGWSSMRSNLWQLSGESLHLKTLRNCLPEPAAGSN